MNEDNGERDNLVEYGQFYRTLRGIAQQLSRYGD